MLDRKIEIYNYMKPYIDKLMLNHFKRIMAMKDENDVLLESGLQQVLFELCKHITYLSLEEKKTMKYIMFLVYRCDILQRKYVIRVHAFDKTIFLDKNSCYEVWNPNFIFDFIDKDLGYLENILYKQFIRIYPWEIEELRIEYASYLVTLVMMFLYNHAELIVKMDCFKRIGAENTMKFYFGEYMGQTVFLGEMSNANGILYS